MLFWSLVDSPFFLFSKVSSNGLLSIRNILLGVFGELFSLVLQLKVAGGLVGGVGGCTLGVIDKR